MKRVKFKVLRFLPGHTIGENIVLKTDQGGTPLDRFWRRRLDERCIEYVSEDKPDNQAKDVQSDKSTKKNSK